ncbi:6609_t:CDS:2 [Funneliformis caledonium]|uniref:6609_t:CDS:1 n=1 Tax=Funneliformis caledonium TaxID=1117310 RepID=A0A9N9C926_9GLOM|nr:6609_t:CDS:2 [Funneliformis caledonium]
MTVEEFEVLILMKSRSNIPILLAAIKSSTLRQTTTARYSLLPALLEEK